MTEQTMKTHQEPSVLSRWGQPSWESRPDGCKHCSHCGSLHPGDVLALLVTPGTKYSGSDWKYGWPHKFYVGAGKFYAAHLLDATEDQLVLWNRVVAALVGVKYTFGDQGMAYEAVRASFQTWGVVGQPDPTAPVVPGWFMDEKGVS